MDSHEDFVTEPLSQVRDQVVEACFWHIILASVEGFRCFVAISGTAIVNAARATDVGPALVLHGRGHALGEVGTVLALD